METIRLVKRLVKIQNLTPAQERSTAAAFNNSKGVIGCLEDYLNYEIQQIDKKLSNPTELYKMPSADRYVTFKLAERANLQKLLDLLKDKVNVLDNDPSGE